MQKKKISITGSCGFIGHNVYRILADQGHEVKGVDSHTDYGFFLKMNWIISKKQERSSPKTTVGTVI